MTFAALLGAYVTLLGAGFGVTSLLLRNSPRINTIECGCLAWLFGTGTISILLWLFGMFSAGLVLQSIVTLLCVGLGLTGWLVQRGVGAKFSIPRPRNAVEWVLAITLTLEVLTIFIVSMKHTLGWDGLLNWEIKARYAFQNSGVIPASYYSSANRGFSHPEYPLCIPFTELWLYLWIGEPNQFWIKSIFPMFYAAGAFLLALFVTRLSGRRWVGLLIANLLPFVPFLLTGSGGVIVGYVDFPLGTAYLAAIGYLLVNSGNVRESWRVFGGLLALLPWLKSEGLILWFVLALAGIGLGLRKKRLLAALISVAPSFLLIIGWRWYLNAMHVVRPADFLSPSFPLLHDNINRLVPIFGLLWKELIETNHWNIFWLIGAIAIVWLIVSRQRTSWLLIGVIIAPVCLYLSTYIFSAWPSYTAHVTSSLPRLLLQILPVTWLAIGLAFAGSLTEQKRPSGID